MTAAGAFDEAAFRTYIADKIASASTAVQGHVNSRLDDCLTDADMAAFNVGDIIFSFFFKRLLFGNQRGEKISISGI